MFKYINYKSNPIINSEEHSSSEVRTQHVLCNKCIMKQNNFPYKNFCQFNKSNRKPDCKGSKHWHNCTDGPVVMSVIEEVDGGDEVGDNV